MSHRMGRGRLSRPDRLPAMLVRATVPPPLALLAAVAVACSAPPAVRTPSPPAATWSAPSPVASRAGGGIETPVASAVPGLPSGFPVYPAAARLPNPCPPAVAIWTTDAAGPAVYRFYQSALPKRGFRILALYPGGAAAAIRFAAPGGRAWQLSLSGDTRHTDICLGPP
ncbi:MAG: hypothetical protein ACR2KI_08845 [Candidatus Limnocylindria bacterium]